MMQLAQQLAKARERIEELETLLEISDKFPRRIVCHGGHHRQITVVVNMLLKREMCSRDALMLALGLQDKSPNTTSVYVSFARKWMRGQGVDLKSVHGVGWYLDAPSKRKLREVLERA